MSSLFGDIIKSFEKPMQRAQEAQKQRTPIWEALNKTLPQYARHCDVIGYQNGVLRLASSNNCALYEMRGFCKEQIFRDLRRAGFKLSNIHFVLTDGSNPTETVERWKQNMYGKPAAPAAMEIKSEDVPF